jgi:uncharacterized protein with HEPN domain
MSRDELMYLRDIIESCNKVQRFTKGISLSDLIQDERSYDAVVRNLEVIGEAAKHISTAIREQIHDVEWRKIAGMRDMLAHAYFGIDNDILWDVIKYKIPQLADAVSGFFNIQRD